MEEKTTTTHRLPPCCLECDRERIGCKKNFKRCAKLAKYVHNNRPRPEKKGRCAHFDSPCPPRVYAWVEMGLVDKGFPKRLLRKERLRLKALKEATCLKK